MFYHYTQTRRQISAFSALLLTLLVAWSQPLFAQFNSANYTYNTLTTGSLGQDKDANALDMSTGTTQAVAAGLDNNNSGGSPINIGFTFWLMGNTYTQFSTSDNGIVQLGSTVVSSATYNVGLGTVASPRIGAFAGDLRVGTDGKVHYKLFGTAPNRVLVIEYQNMSLLYVTPAAVGNGTFQVRLYENGSIIEFAYGSMFRNSGTSAANSQQVGIGFATNSTAGNFAYITSATPTNTTTGTFTQQPYTLSTNIANLHTTTEGSRRIFSYTPTTSVAAPSALTFTPYGTQMQVNWTPPTITNERAYKVYYSLDNVAFTLGATVNVGTNTALVSGLTFDTNYFWRVTSATEGGESAPATGTQATLNTPIAYTWNATSGTADFQVASNWTPNRTVIDNTDVLRFANGGTPTANNIPTQSFRKLRVTGNTAVTLSPTATNTLTLIGDGTPDAEISVDAGSTINQSTNLSINTSAGVPDEQVSIAGTWNVAASATLTLTNLNAGVANITGTVNNAGSVTSNTAAAIFQSGGIYNHTQNAGAVMAATWNTGSATNMTGLTTTAPLFGLNQTFYDFNWNCVGQTTTINISNTAMTVANNFTISNTNGFALRLAGASNTNITAKNVSILATGILSMSNGGIGVGTLRVSGTFNAATAIANGGGTNKGFIEFNGTTAQIPSFAGVNGTNSVSLRINNPAGVALSSTPAFVINDDSTMDMVQGSFTGTLSYGTTSATLSYTGSAAQTIGNELPTVLPPAITIINNSAGVTLPFSRSTNTLNLIAGILTVNTGSTMSILGTIGGSIMGGGATNYVRGTLSRRFGLGSTSYFYPVGKATYNPLTISSVTTSATATVSGTVEVFDVNSGGTPDFTTVGNLQNRYWALTLGGTVANFTSTSQITLQETAPIDNTTRIARSFTQTGTYTSVSNVGTLSSTISSTTGISNANANYFFALGLDNVYTATAQSGNWSDVNTWVGGVVPNSTAKGAIIRNGHTVTLDNNFTANSSIIQVGGSLVANANTLNIQPASGNNATLTVNGGLTIGGGTINVLGNVDISGASAAFTQTAGLLSIDGNGGVGVSVAQGTHLFNITNCTAINGSGGTIRIIDPPLSTYTASTTRAVSIGLNIAPTALFFTGTHTFEFGDGTSTTAGNTDGFVIDTYVGSIGTRTGLNNVTVNAGNPAGRWVTGTYCTSCATTILGTLTINSGSEFRHTLSTATLNVAGNVMNSGTFTCDKTVTFAGVSPTGGTAPAANAQTVSGGGVFRNLAASPTANFASIAFNNTSTGGVTFNIGNFNSWGTITFTAGKVNLSGNTFTLGISTVSRGALTYTAGGFANGTFTRWVSTIELPTSAPTTPNFPFVALSNGADRSVFLFRSATGSLTSGTISVSHTDATGFTPRAIFETCDTGSNGTWNFNNGNSLNPTGGATFSANIRAYQMVSINDAALLRMLESTGSTVRGTHATSSGTVTAPIISRTGLVLADITNITYSLNTQAANTSNTIVSATSGNWTTPATWVGGVVPTNADEVQILAGHNVNVDANGQAAALTIQVGGTLTHTTNGVVLDIAKTGRNDSYLVNKGTLTVGGNAATTLNLNGYVLIENGANFTQSNGTINVDGNSGTAATSVPNTNDIFAWGIGTATATRYNTGTTTLTGGQINIIDPHAITTAPIASAQGHSFAYRSDNNLNANPAHTLQFGDGTSTQAGGNTSGFTYSYFASGAGRFASGNFIANGTTSAANRLVTVLGTTSFGILGNFTTTANSTFNTGLTMNVGGNINNAGTTTISGIASLNMSNLISGANSSVTIPQTITSTGTLTIGSGGLQLDNTSAGGVTLNNNITTPSLTLSNGIVYTGANTLTVNGAISGGTATNYVNGKLARVFPFSGITSRVFPVGKGTYKPVDFEVNASGLGNPIVQIEVFDSNAGGTADGTVVGSLATNRYWKADVISSLLDINSYKVTLAETLTAPDNRINVASTAAGTYTNVNTTGTGTGSSIISNAGLVPTASNFFVISSVSPTITGFTPTSGGVDVTVTITGTNFTGATAVTIGGVPARSFTVVNANTITAVTNDNFTTGLVTVTNGITVNSSALVTPNFTRLSCVNPVTSITGVTNEVLNGVAGIRVNWNNDGSNPTSTILLVFKPANLSYYTARFLPGTATTFRIGQVEGNAMNYEIYLQSYCGGTTLGNRISTTFTTNTTGGTICSTPTGNNVTLNGGTQAIFTWNPAPNAAMYQVMYQLTNAAGTTGSGGMQTYLTAPTTSWTVSGLTPMQYYRFRVKNVCTLDNTVNTPFNSFVVVQALPASEASPLTPKGGIAPQPPTGGVDVITSNSLPFGVGWGGAALYPNPAQDQVTISLVPLSESGGLSSPFGSRGAVVVVDLLGRTVLQPVEFENQTTLNVKHLASGSYVVKITTEQGEVVSRKLVVE